MVRWCGGGCLLFPHWAVSASSASRPDVSVFRGAASVGARWAASGGRLLGALGVGGPVGTSMCLPGFCWPGWSGVVLLPHVHLRSPGFPSLLLGFRPRFSSSPWRARIYPHSSLPPPAPGPWLVLSGSSLCFRASVGPCPWLVAPAPSPCLRTSVGRVRRRTPCVHHPAILVT